MLPRHERALAACRLAGAHGLVSAHPATVAWLTGASLSTAFGPSPYGMPPVVVLTPSSVLLVVDEDDAAVVRAAPSGVVLADQVVTYPGYHLGPLRGGGLASATLQKAVGGLPVLVEVDATPAGLMMGLRQVGNLRPPADPLASARAIKDPDEVARIRHALLVSARAQGAVASRAEAGLSELDLWAAAQDAANQASGRPVVLLADLLSGPRTAQVTGPPTRRTLARGDAVLADLAPLVDGYWGDTSTTRAVGEPSPELERLHHRVRARLEAALGAVRPGVTAGDLDTLIRDDLGFPHHSGHGLGTRYHEEPRIVPNNPWILAEGMVVALGPAAYAEEFGVRLEQVVLVTADGCELLSSHDTELVSTHGADLLSAHDTELVSTHGADLLSTHGLDLRPQRR